jgi:N-acetylmuramoyl-L-alanine amidase
MSDSIGDLEEVSMSQRSASDKLMQVSATKEFDMLKQFGWVLCTTLIMSMSDHAHARSPSHRAELTINTQGLNTAQKRELLCHSLNMYHEARGTNIRNQVAVAWVVRNRMALSGRSACEVIYAPRQFSWTSRRLPAPREASAWRQSQELALMVMQDQISDITRGATHFHEANISPTWSRNARNSMRIGAHTFFRLHDVAEAR